MLLRRRVSTPAIAYAVCPFDREARNRLIVFHFHLASKPRISEADGRLPVSRFKRAEPMLAAAERWKRRCLLDKKSLFTERSLWTREGFDELRRLYVESIENGLPATSFLDELERTVKPGSPDASCLWAEMTWVYLLIHRPGSMGAAKKRSQIGNIWNWSGREFPEDHELLNDAVLEAGVAHPGPAYAVHAWREFRFFTSGMLRWFSLEADERESFLDRPWEFAKWLDDTEHVQKRMFRHILLFLLFPDEFEPISTSGHKRKMVSRLHQGDRVDASNEVELDRAILAIRRRLEDEVSGRGTPPVPPPIQGSLARPSSP